MKNRLCKMRILSNEINIAEEKIMKTDYQVQITIKLDIKELKNFRKPFCKTTAVLFKLG